MYKKINIGILIDSTSMPVWIERMVHKLNETNYAEVKLFIILDQNQIRSDLSKLTDLFKKLFFLIFSHLEKRIFKVTHNPFKKTDLKFFTNIPNLKIALNPDKIKQSNGKNSDKIEDYNLDLIINLCSNKSEFTIPKVPQYGMWEIIYSDHSRFISTPAGFWEVLKSEPQTGIMLNIKCEGNNETYNLYSSFSLTDPHSVSRNAANLYWKASIIVPRKIKELYDCGKDSFFEKLFLENQHPQIYSNKIYNIPSNFQMSLLIIIFLYKYVKNKLSDLLYNEQWELHYLINFENKLANNLNDLSKIIPPKDRFWADPDFVKKDGKYYLFFEEYIYKNKKAHISYIELEKNGQYSNSKIVIENKYHMSFPYLFNINENLYMIPETSENKTIELYKCLHFPDKWKLEKTLMENIIAVDTNLFYYNNKWWLFTNIKEIEGVSIYDELFLFYTDNFKSGHWVPHPMNPIISDVKSARPAGHIFIYNNNIYRPSQNCSKRYGYGLKLNEIVKLNENEYAETEILNIEPSWGKRYLGTHTLNYKNEFTIIDVLKKRRKIF